MPAPQGLLPFLPMAAPIAPPPAALVAQPAATPPLDPAAFMQMFMRPADAPK
jgi:hypothetical protein